jgi:ATP-dependent DNA helicase PIF1
VDFLRKMLDRLGKPGPQSRQETAFLREDLACAPSGTPRRTQEGSSRDVGRIERNAITNPKVPPKPNTTTSSPTDRAAALVGGSAKAILILGGAGTGKTTFLYALQKDQSRKQVFLAPTGVAALHLRGQTLHSFFGIPPRIINHDEISIRTRQRKLFRNIDRLVIDEISMVRADLLDVVDRTLRMAREEDLPFGGVQVVLVGDFFQLPPVVTVAEEDMLDRLGYSGPYSFNSRVFRELAIDRVPFVKVYRQTDPAFVQCLNQLRRGVGISAALEMINEACVRPHRPQRIPVILTPTNGRADAYNHDGLARLHTAERVYVGAAAGTFGTEGDRLPVPESLALKVGARVMAVRNDPGKRWVNGSVGTITALASDRVTVRLDAGTDVEIERFTWEKIRYEWDAVRARVGATVVGTYTQLPVVHAWALTIHKAQGHTLEDARVDFDYGAFAPGQAYVAVSRSRSMPGLSLARPIRGSEIKVDPRVAMYMAAFET